MMRWSAKQIDSVVAGQQGVRDEELSAVGRTEDADALLRELLATPPDPGASSDRRQIVGTKRGRRRGLRRISEPMLALGALVAGLVVVALATPGGDSGLQPPVAAAGVEIDRKGEYFVARVTDLNADPEAMRAAFAEHGFDIELRFRPAPPSEVGEIVGGTYDYSDATSGEVIKHMEACDRDRPIPCRRIGLRIPKDFHGSALVVLGRPAEKGERYFTALDAFLPGEPLHCSGLIGLTVKEAQRELTTRGDLAVRWRVLGQVGNVPADSVADHFVNTGFSPAPGVVVLVVTEGSLRPHEGFTPKRYRSYIGRGC